MMKGAADDRRDLLVILGDQLDANSLLLREGSKQADCIWMAESRDEAGKVWSTKARVAYFFAAMRHFREELREDGWTVEYRECGEHEQSLAAVLVEDLKRLRPKRVRCCLPGEWDVLEQLRGVCERAEVELEVLADEHFLDTPERFRKWAEGRKQVRLEYYYREMRKRHGILLTADGKPEGGQWNYDGDNRKSFGKDGPDGLRAQPPEFKADDITRSVLREVEQYFGEHPGQLERFNWPVTRAEALRALRAFVEERLPEYGLYQDAMWTEEPFLYHSLLSAALNLKLLHPREVVEAAEEAYREGMAPLNAVEGFVRQILGWREYVRGIYWWKMPEYREGNYLEAEESLPEFYWTGETPLRCLRETIGQTLEYGYAHHIQRLMVTGLYALLLGVKPQQVHEWYLAVYVDAVEWVELPNTLGMSQFADGGLMASKPYAATGKYLSRMSNYCKHCPANPKEATGKRACPFTTLYWDFLIRHHDRLRDNPRMRLQLRNVERLPEERRTEILEAAELVRADPGCGKRLGETA